MVARLHRLAWALRRYHWQGASMQRWLSLLLLVLAGIAALNGLPGRWLTAAALVGLWLLMLAGTWRSAQTHHVRFTPQALPSPPPQPLAPEEKYPLAATGRFEVEGKGKPFTQLKAYFRTFATREHAVMAFVEPTPFLLLWRLPALDLGMWYIFFTPDALRSIEPGQLAFGRQQLPALRLTLHRAEQEKPEHVYLAFADPSTMTKVWADLLADGA